MTTILIGIGMVCVIEGLALALAPSYYERVVAALAEISAEQRRAIGLVAIAVGVGVLWLAG